MPHVVPAYINGMIFIKRCAFLARLQPVGPQIADPTLFKPSRSSCFSERGFRVLTLDTLPKRNKGEGKFSSRRANKKMPRRRMTTCFVMHFRQIYRNIIGSLMKHIRIFRAWLVCVLRHAYLIKICERLSVIRAFSRYVTFSLRCSVYISI